MAVIQNNVEFSVPCFKSKDLRDLESAIIKETQGPSRSDLEWV